MPGIWEAPLKAIKFILLTVIDYKYWDGFVFFNGQQIRGSLEWKVFSNVLC